jgi:hypothetical protein
VLGLTRGHTQARHVGIALKVKYFQKPLPTNELLIRKITKIPETPSADRSASNQENHFQNFIWEPKEEQLPYQCRKLGKQKNLQ